jgi:hypothetical protein
MSSQINRGKVLREVGSQTKVRAVEVVAEYKPDAERMLQALMLILDIDDLPASENEDALHLSDSIS